jgi:hypothetical protein
MLTGGRAGVQKVILMDSSRDMLARVREKQVKFTDGADR